MKKFYKILSYTLIIVFILLIAIFKHTSKPEEYTSTNLYKKTSKQFSNIELQTDFSSSDTVQAGWYKMNITPTQLGNMGGYSVRKFTGIEDSLYVRTIVFKNNRKTIAYLSYDLIIVSKDLAKAVREKLKRFGLSVDGIYFSAIHSHSSFGNWAKAFGMQIIYGRYKRKQVDEIATKTVLSIEKALSSAKPISFGYTQIPTTKTVRNHFGKEFHSDTLLRVIKMVNSSGETAYLSSFSAHATYLHPQYKKLSGDYPGAYNTIIENDDSTCFSIFSAGAVACHRLYLKFPTKDSTYGYRSHKDVRSYANYLAKQLERNNDSFQLKKSTKLDYKKIEIPLSTPEARIRDKISFRSWVIYLLTGKPHPYINYLRLGDIVFIGNPCDISGELYPEFDSIIKEKNIDLILTSFNGEYIGYVIPDHHYNKKESEAREMNWYRAGSHFTFMIKSILNKTP